MINIILYEHSKDFYKNSTWSALKEKKLTIVTPNPAFADIARLKFAELDIEIEAITISKFIEDEFQKLTHTSEKTSLSGKSDLMSLLVGLLNIKFSGWDVEFFKSVFNIVTDIRSYSLSQEVLESVLEEGPDDIKEAALLFSLVIGELGLIDATWNS